MALIPYKNPGDSLTSDEWNTIFAAADDILTNYLNGLSPLFFGENGDPRKFFFFDPVTPPAAQLHPLAPAWLAAPPAGSIRQGFLRQYNHGAITSLVAGLASLPLPTASVLSAAIIYGGYGSNYQVGDVLTLVGGTFIRPATVTVTSIQYGYINGISIADPGAYSVVPAAPVYLSGGHGTNARLNYVNFGSSTINPFAVTKLTAPTTAAWHAAIFPENGYGASDASYYATINLDICLSVLTRAGNAVTLGSGYSEPANGFLNNGAVEMVHNYDAVEIIVVGSVSFDSSWTKYNAFRIHNFGLSAATVLGVTIPPGGCKCVRRVSGNLVPGYNYFQKMVAGDPRFFALAQNVSNQLCPFNTAALISTLGLPAGNGVPSNSLDLSKAWDMSALYTSLLAPPAGSSVIFDLLGGFGKVTVGATSYNFTGWGFLAALFTSMGRTWAYNPTTKQGTITGPPGKVLTDVGANLVKLLTAARTPPVHSIALGTSFTADLSAASTFNRIQRLVWHIADTDAGGGVIVHNAGCILDSTDTAPGVTFTVADTIQKILDCLNALACPLISLQTITLLNTPFGPVLYWEEVYSINKYFDVNRIGGAISRFVKGTSVILGKMFMLAGSFQNFFLLAAAPLSQIHFPRKGRVYSALRAVVHDGSVEQWQANTSAYTTYEPPQLKRFFESQPIGTEAPLAAAQISPVTARPDGASYLGPLDGVTVPSNAAESLLCLVEHYNALASQINGLPVTPAKKPVAAPGIPTYSPTGVPAPGGGTQPYFPRNCYFSWMAPATGTDTTAAAMVALGLSVQAALPDGYGNPVLERTATYNGTGFSYSDTSGYWGGFDAAFQADAALYRWVTIDDARALYSRLGIPFVLDAVGTPMAFHVQSATLSANDVLNADTVAVITTSAITGVGTAFSDPVGAETFYFAGGGSVSFPQPGNLPGPMPLPRPPSAARDNWVTDTWIGSAAFSGLRQAAFITDANGSWLDGNSHALTSLATPASSNSAGGPANFILNVNNAAPHYTPGVNNIDGWINGSLSGNWGAFGIQPAGDWYETTSSEWQYTQQNKTCNFTIDWGVLNPVIIGPLLMPAVCILAENVASKCVVVLPRNYAPYVGGTLIADNGQEDIAPQVILIDGSGQLGCETLITCPFANANLILFPINNTFTPGIGAGSDNVGAGDDSWSAGN